MISFPSAIDGQYLRWLLGRLTVAQELTKRSLEEGTADDEPLEQLAARVTATHSSYERAIPIRAESLTKIAQAVQTVITAAVARELDRAEGGRPGASVVDPPLTALIGRWVLNNIELVARSEREAFADVASRVASEGAGAAPDRWKRARSRAALIARNEVGNLAAQINEARQRARGVNSYRWVSRRDERVRQLHLALDGEIRRWDDPHPTEGHPGHAIGCRCMAQPVREPPRATSIPSSVVFPAAPAAPKPARKRSRPKPAPQPPPTPPLTAPAPPPARPPPPAGLDLSQVDELRLFPGLSADERRDALTRAFGRNVTPEEIVGWSGLRQSDLGPGARVELHSAGRTVELRVTTPKFTLTREYKRSAVDSKLMAEHASIEVRQEYQGSGIGTELFTRSVEALQRAGFARIDAYAAGSAADPVHNGYYTWPRLGYDAQLPANLLEKLPPGLRGATTVQSLISTPEGLAWWKANGKSTYVSFDLSAGSPSMRVLEQYLAERSARRDSSRWRPRFDAQDRTGPVEEIDLSPDEEAALVRAWATIHGARNRWRSPQGVEQVV